MPNLPGEKREEVEWYEVYPYHFDDGRENIYRHDFDDYLGWHYVQDANLRQRIWTAFGEFCPQALPPRNEGAALC